MKAVKIILLFILLISFLILCKSLFLGYYPDFSGYYFGPKVLIAGHNPYLGGKDFFTPFVYPPFVLLFFSPFLFLSFQSAEILWTCLSILLLFVSLGILIKLNHQKFFSIPSILIGILSCWYFPAKFTLGMGQINIFILFLMCVGLLFYCNGKKYIPGILFGVAVLLKLFPVLVLFYFLLKKDWKVVISFAATICFGLLLTFLFIPKAVNIYFYHTTLPLLLSGWKIDYYNQSLSGFLGRAGLATSFGNIIKIILSLCMGIVTFLSIFLRKNNTKQYIILSIGSIITLSMLINSFSWQHHFVWLLIPFITTFCIVLKLKNFLYFSILAFSYFLVAGNMKSPQVIPIFLLSHVFYGAFILWLFDMYLLKVLP